MMQIIPANLGSFCECLYGEIDLGPRPLWVVVGLLKGPCGRMTNEKAARPNVSACGGGGVQDSARRSVYQHHSHTWQKLVYFPETVDQEP